MIFKQANLFKLTGVRESSNLDGIIPGYDSVLELCLPKETYALSMMDEWNPVTIVDPSIPYRVGS